MIRGLLGKKVGMTQIFDKEGNIIPVTAIEVGPCVVLGLKESPMKVVLGFEPVKETALNKPRTGYFKKLGVAGLRKVKEFTSTDNKVYTVGQEIKADLFKAGDFVDISGVSIGKGFQGGMKRWNWGGGPAAHGSMHHRRVGSIGSSSDPSRVYKGQHMPGHMGMDKITTQNLRVMSVDVENNLILVKGAVPGHKNGYLTVNKALKKVFRSLDEKREVVESKRNPMKQSKAAAKGGASKGGKK
ncbi:MAG: 50S ribosomal protein L3 [Candidatus Omnitrophica bacterium]|nr:50S ribosomal protein L3 [Candidatus Omnitrophota bacterium]